MRHLKSGSKLGRNPSHRRATLRALVTNLFEHGRITTTLTRAKAARPVAEKIITLGKRDTLQSRRQAASYIMLPAITQKLFSEIAPKFSDRAGGYTRIIHAGNRVGDNAKVAILELVGYEFKAKEKKDRPKKEEAVDEKKLAEVFRIRNSNSPLRIHRSGLFCSQARFCACPDSRFLRRNHIHRTITANTRHRIQQGIVRRSGSAGDKGLMYFVQC